MTYMLRSSLHGRGEFEIKVFLHRGLNVFNQQLNAAPVAVTIYIQFVGKMYPRCVLSQGQCLFWNVERDGVVDFRRVRVL